MPTPNENPDPVKDEMTERVIGLAMRVHRVLGPGFLESVYRNALVQELLQAQIFYETEKSLKVYYGKATVGQFSVDLLVDHWLICELKATQNLNDIHEMQLINYLTATKHDYGLLINFGGKSLQVKRKYRRIKSETPTVDLHA